ncbi:hypothetical protein DFP73DRAFT_265946 [Morchella snyderi]|nr:hypothetical protein DFP73DRAFT_265946 [Morchella snyderi]
MKRMFLLRPPPLLLITINLFITIALCSPVPLTVWVTATSTVKAPVATPTDTLTCGKVVETEGLGVKVRFRTEPTDRGTVGILLSCLATYIFCVWTTVAPAVIETKGNMRRMWYKLVLTLIAIIAPAAIMVYALGEYLQAKDIRAAWKKYLKPDMDGKEDKDGKSGEEANETDPRLQKDTFQGGKQISVSEQPRSDAQRFFELDIGTAFFVMMGGFRVENKEPDYIEETKASEGERSKVIWRKKKYQGGDEVYHRPILTPYGFMEYIKTNRIVPGTFNQRDVLDKGKGTLVAKTLAAIQAVWLILQSLGRAAAGLPLTLLEIHVLIQILCTSVIFYCWWGKPLDVGVPTTIQLERGLNKRALNKAQLKAQKHAEPKPQEAKSPEVEAQAEDHAQGQGQGDSRAQSPLQKHPRWHSTPEPSSPGSTSSRAYTYAGDTPHSRATSPCMRSDTTASRLTGNSTLFGDAISDTPVEDTSKGVKDTGQPVADYIIKSDYLSNRNSDYKGGTGRPLKTAAQIANDLVAVTAKACLDVAVHARPVYNDDKQIGLPQTKPSDLRSPWQLSDEVTSNTKQVMINVFLVILTASLHLAAWNTFFPSSLEMWLWRASCFCMIGLPTWIIAVTFFNDYDQDLFNTLWHAHLRENQAFRGLFPFVWGEIKGAIQKRSKKENDREEELAASTMVLHHMLLGSCMIAVGLYSVASLFITLESFISLRWLTDEHFLTPKWSNFIPHL